MALVIFGYPIAGALHSIVGGASQTFSHPMRGITLLLALAVIFFGFRSSQFRMIDKLLAFFLAAYTLRLLYDWIIADIPGADNALLYFYVLVVVPLLACAMKAPLITEERLQIALLVFGGIFVFLIISARNAGLAYNPWSDVGYELTRLGFEALNPISIGRAAGALAIVGVFMAANRDASRRWRAIGVTAFAVGLYVIILANSRGPLAALIVTFCFVFISRPSHLLWGLAAVGAYFVVFGSESILFTNVFERFALAGAAEDGASQIRFMIMNHAWAKFIENPILGYHFIDPILGEGLYPHNLILEAAMAHGIFGLVIFVALIIRAFTIAMLTHRRRFPTLAALFIYFFVATNFSGALWGSQEFFVTMAVCLALAKRRAQV